MNIQLYQILVNGPAISEPETFKHESVLSIFHVSKFSYTVKAFLGAGWTVGQQIYQSWRATPHCCRAHQWFTILLSVSILNIMFRVPVLCLSNFSQHKMLVASNLLKTEKIRTMQGRWKSLPCSVFVQLWTGFSAYNSKRRSLNYNIPESDLIDLTETICSDQKTWEG